MSTLAFFRFAPSCQGRKLRLAITTRFGIFGMRRCGSFILSLTIQVMATTSSPCHSIPRASPRIQLKINLLMGSGVSFCRLRESSYCCSGLIVATGALDRCHAAPSGNSICLSNPSRRRTWSNRIDILLEGCRCGRVTMRMNRR
jgi:hypothetical protein